MIKEEMLFTERENFNSRRIIKDDTTRK